MIKSGEKPSKRNVALLCQHFYPEMVSTGMHMTELALGLTQRGWNITVYCAKPSWGSELSDHKLPRREDYEGIHVVRVPTLGAQKRGLFLRALFAVSFLLMSAWSVVTTLRLHDGWVFTTNPPFVGLIGCLVRRITKKPYLLIVYDVYPDIAVQCGALPAKSPIRYLWDCVARWILKSAHTIVVIGRDMEKVIRNKLKQSAVSSIALVPNWSDEKRVRPVCPDSNHFVQEYGLPGKLVVQYAGRMGRTHNLEPLVQAAALLRDKPIVFQFVGDGAKKVTLQEMVREHQLPNVQFVPHQPMERLAEMLSAASISVVCLETLYTGLSVPSKTYGAMASGNPILAFLDPESEIGLTIIESGCGFVLRDPDGAQVAEALENLISNPRRLLELGHNARQKFLQDYTLSKAVDRYNALLEKMCASQATPQTYC